MFINNNYWDYIPDTAPNKDYYKKYVCDCRSPYISFSIPIKQDPELAVLYSKKLFAGICTKCNKLPKSVMRQCTRCTSVFCTIFHHPRQTTGRDFMYGKVYCWNCLDAGYGTMGTNKYVREAVPPIPELLNPVYIKPSFEDMFGESIDDFLNSL